MYHAILMIPYNRIYKQQLTMPERNKERSDIMKTLISFLIPFFIGLICIIIGIVTIREQLVSIASMHQYVKDKNKKSFSRLIGMCTIGIGLSLMCFPFCFMSMFIFIPIAITLFIISLAIYFIAQYKYNNSNQDAALEKAELEEQIKKEQGYR